MGESTISMRHVFQILLAVLAVWTAIAGILIAVVGGTVARVLTGVEDNPAANHIIGAHFLLIAPVYVLLIKNMDRYRSLIWFPFAAQAAVLVPALFDVFGGNRDLADAIVQILVSASFLAVIVGVLVYRERPGSTEMTTVIRPVPGARPSAPASSAVDRLDPTPDLGAGRFKRTVVPPPSPAPGSPPPPERRGP
jgi:hypothetical protein